MLSENIAASALYHCIWLVPLIGSIGLSLLFRASEPVLSRVIGAMSFLSAMASLFVIVSWMGQPATGLLFKNWILPQWMPGHLEILMRMDVTGVVFSTLTTFFQLIIVRFSRVYLHREEGYSRFFALIFLLTAGMQILALADNLEVFFVGWEFIGLASFFLVAFYRRQERTANNALKIISVYRIGDLGLVAAMVIFHLLNGLHPETRLSDISQSFVAAQPAGISLYILFFGLIVAAAAKSAQFPFTFWLPKAMEGPTPSSAIFYGALSVHAGALLILRLHPLWSAYPMVAFALGAVGLLTVVFGIGSGRVQTSIKGQLAYASAVQVGFIFIEMAFGYTSFATFHIASHALYRSLQLIVSPSIITHIMNLNAHDRNAQSHRRSSFERLLPDAVRQTLYVLAFQENFFEHALERWIVSPLHAYRSKSRQLGIFIVSTLLMIAVGGYVAGWQQLLIYCLTFCALNLSIQSAVEEDSPRRAVDKILLAQATLGVAGFAASKGSNNHELAHIMVSMLPFALFLKWSLRDGKLFSLRGYSGLFGVNPMAGWILFLAMGGIIGFPPLPGFFFEDLLMAHFLDFGPLTALMAGLSLAITGIAGFRICALVTMGDPTKELLARSPRYFSYDSKTTLKESDDREVDRHDPPNSPRFRLFAMISASL